MSRFRLVLPAVSGPASSVEVDGQTVNGARSVAVKAEMGEATKLYIELPGEGTIEGEGIVHVVRADSGNTVADWLGNIDSDELEKAALDHMGGLAGGSTGAAFLDVLRGWAGGGT